MGCRIILALTAASQHGAAGGVVGVLGLAIVGQLGVGLERRGEEPGCDRGELAIVAELGEDEPLGGVGERSRAGSANGPEAGGGSLAERRLDQRGVVREPLAILPGRRHLAADEPHVQLQDQQLAEQRRADRLGHVGQMGLDPRPLADPPGALELVTDPVHFVDVAGRHVTDPAGDGPFALVVHSRHLRDRTRQVHGSHALGFRDRI
jgi:hypothetical protein